jgi:hypothetical protein
MAHKHTQVQIDTVINKWRGKHAVEKMVGEYDGSKWSRYQRFRLQGGTIFHISTDSLKLTISPPDSKAEANGGSFSGSGTPGYVSPDNAYVTYTNPYLLQPFLAATQITELGNALDLISGTQTPQQAKAQDSQPTLKPNPLLGNNNDVPGVKLLDCLMEHGGLKR